MSDHVTDLDGALVPAGAEPAPSSPDALLPDAVASAASPSDPAPPEQAPVPGPEPHTAPQPAEAMPSSHVTPNASDKRGDLFMRVLSRSLTDIAVLTRGQRVATHEETGAAVRHAMLMEGVPQRPMAKDAGQPVAPLASVQESPPAGGAAQQLDTQEGAQKTVAAKPSFSLNKDTLAELEKNAREEAQRDQRRPRPVPSDNSGPASVGDKPASDAASMNVQNGVAVTDGQGAEESVIDQHGTGSPKNFMLVGPDGKGDIAAGFLKRADQSDAPAWLEGHLHEFPLQSVVDNFTHSQNLTEITAVRDKALEFASDNPDLAMTKAFAGELTKYIDENQDIVVLGNKHPQKISSLDNTKVQLQLPEGGRGFVNYGVRNNQYATARTLGVLNTIADTWAATHNQPIQIGNISRQGGGAIEPHKAHRRGTEVDIRPFRKDGRRGPVTYRSAEYDRDATIELIRVIRQQHPNVTILFNDPEIIGLGLSRHYAGHDDHMHVSFK
jgi:hypothetical protein